MESGRDAVPVVNLLPAAASLMLMVSSTNMATGSQIINDTAAGNEQVLPNSFHRSDNPNLPFRISAPWPFGVTWFAGRDDGGSFYGEGLHTGSDYYAIDFNQEGNRDKGTLVLAAADGIVSAAGCGFGGYGCMVVISHYQDDQYCYASRYAHLMETPFFAKDMMGKFVAQGTPIGRVGSTGLPPNQEHLHFAIYRVEAAFCNSAITMKGDERNAIAPIPMDGIGQIADGQDIQSTTFPVGYEEFSNAQIHSASSNDFIVHRAIADHYEAKRWLLVVPNDYVRTLGAGEIYYQVFQHRHDPSDDADSAPLEGNNLVFVERNSESHFILWPIWMAYMREPNPWSTVGTPTSDTYEFSTRTGPGYRNDFANGSIVYVPSTGLTELLNRGNAEWAGLMWNHPDSQAGVAYLRLDKEINFSWSDSTLPGPFFAPDGFTSKWSTRMGSFLSTFRVVVEVQGRATVSVDNRKLLSVDSPREVSTRTSRTIQLGEDRIDVTFWQENGLPASIAVTASSSYVPSVFALETDEPSRSRTLTGDSPLIPRVPLLLPEQFDRSSPIGEDEGSSSFEFNGIVIDDLSARFRQGQGEWIESSQGLGSHHWETMNSPSGGDATWLLNPGSSGIWEVFVYIPGTATTNRATYELHHNGLTVTLVVDQQANSNSWVSLGEYYFAGVGEEYLELSSQTDEPANTRTVAFDAAGLRWIGEPQTNMPNCLIPAGTIVAGISLFAKRRRRHGS